MVDNYTPQFIARVNISPFVSSVYGCSIPPGRIYLHEYGNHLYGLDKETSLFSMFKQGIEDSFDDPSLRFDYLVGVAWGNPDTREKMIDCFGFTFGSDWPGNPDISNWTIKNGCYVRDYVLHSGNMTCGDGLIILGKEEEYRRKCKDLEEFLTIPPKILLKGK